MSTKLLLIFLIMVIVLAVVAAFLARMKSPGKKSKGIFTQRALATANEQGMFWRLVECFPMPEHIVLTQVSFGALLEAREGASRYSFSQKRADFVLLDKSFKVIAVIELDDNSHRGKEGDDQKRDAMLELAGYKVLRFTRTPDKAELMAALRAFV